MHFGGEKKYNRNTWTLILHDAGASNFSLCSAQATGCPSGYFSPILNGATNTKCVKCSNPICQSGQYQVECSAFADTECMPCGNCSIGYYLSGCTANVLGTCVPCTTKYESQCSGSSISLSMYTGSGSLNSDNCPWLCVATYFRYGSLCNPCTTSPCNAGYFRGNCSALSDAPCKPCSGLPNNAIFTSAGSPANVDNCQWACSSQKFYLDQASRTCVACAQPAQCPAGTTLTPCTGTSNYQCQPCSPQPAYSVYSTPGSCAFVCISGFFLHGSTCSPCNNNLSCSNGQRKIDCTSLHDASCTDCLEGVQYLSDGPSCKNCSQLQCNYTGTYLMECTAVSDSKCGQCSMGPLNSYYVGAGSKGNNDCPWLCHAGYERARGLLNSTDLCVACSPGTFSLGAASTCQVCTAGSYSASVASSSPADCTPCSEGKFSTQAGASSPSDCSDCSIGFYQSYRGQSSCDPCPQNQYGSSTGASSSFQCLSCPTADTTTRGKTGQGLDTSCICNNDYYRVRNDTSQCQKCPPGLICTGYSQYTPVVNQSEWKAVTIASNDYYVLYYCPAGYQYPDLLTVITAENIASIIPNQQCTACSAGYECVQPPCLSCSKCPSGKFKSCSGPTPCIPCPVNTFEPGNGSVECQQCDSGTATDGNTGCKHAEQCVCDTKHYNFGQGDGCQECPIGMQCFGNATAIALPIQFGIPIWDVVIYQGMQKYNLSFCPQGYYIAGLVSTPAELQCIPCSAGFECPLPPCFGACTKCRAGHYKAATLSYSMDVPGSTYDPVSSSYVLSWIKEPCYPCPVDTYRSLQGGTEVASCLACPTRSTTNGINGSTAVSDCSCESFYYQQATSTSSSMICGDCPLGCVCSSDRSCSLGLLSDKTFKEGDTQAYLRCSNLKDTITGTWQRQSTGEYALVACPAGYTMQVSNLTVTLDTCVMCPAGSYLLDEVTSPLVICNPCPIGADCPGGSVLNALPGYWQAPTSRREVSNKAIIYQCPIGVCDKNNTCSNNRVGLVTYL